MNEDDPVAVALLVVSRCDHQAQPEACEQAATRPDEQPGCEGTGESVDDGRRAETMNPLEHGKRRIGFVDEVDRRV